MAEGLRAQASAIIEQRDDSSLSHVNLVQLICDLVSSSVKGANIYLIVLLCGFTEVVFVKGLA